MRLQWVLPVAIAVIALSSFGLLDDRLAQQDTNWNSFLSAATLPLTGLGGENQLIRVNLHNYQLSLFEDGRLYTSAKIAGQGNPYTRAATPTGNFRILSKEKLHVSRLSGGRVLMPLAMRFYEGYYFHDIPLYIDGTVITTKYSWGCIRIPNDFAQTFYDWTRVGAYVEIYRASLVKNSSDPRVYHLTEDGLRQPIATEQAFISRGFRWQDIAVIPTEELDALPQGEMLY